MPIEPIRRLSAPARASERDLGPDLSRDWLVTNGLGGYASGTVLGVPTRRYHALLVAALPAPRGRMIVLNQLVERYEGADGASARFGGMEKVGESGVTPPVDDSLREFRLEAGLPVWTFSVGEATLERRVVLVHGRNEAHVMFRVVSGEGPVRVRLRPFWNIRAHDAPVSTPLEEDFAWKVDGARVEVPETAIRPGVRLQLRGPRAEVEENPEVADDLFYRVEAERGDSERGDLRSPGEFSIEVVPGRSSGLSVSLSDWEAFAGADLEDVLEREQGRRAALLAKAPEKARRGVAAELVLAADTFLIRPATRERSEGGELASTVIAGYPWFTDWGRDTMISLPGLTLSTGRFEEARHLLRTFADALRDGLIPNLFPEGQAEGVYHTADATLWYFHALEAYVQATGDRAFLEELLPRMLEVIERHRAGTRFGIGVDPKDGLLRQGAPGYQLTWMDAKVGDWVVTPRRGKAVEINALWYNALRLASSWVREARSDAEAEPMARLADQARESFNRRFWNPATKALFDVVDGEEGDDPTIRPNQVLAVSLPHAVLDRERWEAVVSVCERLLRTPVGLRSLAPGSEHYHPRYIGDLQARDAAYHNGTVWGWLIGPFLDAWLKVYPDDREGARERLLGFVPHLDEECVGSISEIFDAEPPFTPRGCFAQAWSVAEVLREWLRSEAD